MLTDTNDDGIMQPSTIISPAIIDLYGGWTTRNPRILHILTSG